MREKGGRNRVDKKQIGETYLGKTVGLVIDINWLNSVKRSVNFYMSYIAKKKKNRKKKHMKFKI